MYFCLCMQLFTLLNLHFFSFLLLGVCPWFAKFTGFKVLSSVKSTDKVLTCAYDTHLMCEIETERVVCCCVGVGTPWVLYAKMPRRLGHAFWRLPSGTSRRICLCISAEAQPCTVGAETVVLKAKWGLSGFLKTELW